MPELDGKSEPSERQHIKLFVNGGGSSGSGSGSSTSSTVHAASAKNRDSISGGATTFSLSLLRSACDTCWRKKSRCSGDMPCERCERTGVQCTYSTKRKLGRPKRIEAAGGGQREAAAAAAAAAKKRKKQWTCCQSLSCTSSPFSPSPTTALAGLAESKFLSCFLEHFCPMFPIADEVSIRDGLMHAFAGAWKGSSSSPLQGNDALRGRALECSFFSSVAIGGLLSGCPVAMVASHLETAQAAIVEFRGLSDHHAVSALLLHGMMMVLLPLAGSNAEGRRSLDEAQVILESLPEKPPLTAVVLSFRRQVEGLSLLGGDALGAASAAGSSAARTTGAGTPRSALPNPPAPLLSEGAHTEEGVAILKGVELARGPGAEGPTVLVQNAHPAYVVADALLLSVRFVRDQGRAGSVRLRHVHDFVASELNRLVRAKAGAMALVSLAGVLLGIKTKLQLAEGMLDAANLVSSMLQECPGWARSYGRHAGHLSLAVFRLHGQQEAYDILRSIVGEANDEFIPDLGACEQSGGHVCGLEVCTTLARLLMDLKPLGTVGEKKVSTAGQGSSGGQRAAIAVPRAKAKRQRRTSARRTDWLVQRPSSLPTLNETKREEEDMTPTPMNDKLPTINTMTPPPSPSPSPPTPPTAITTTAANVAIANLMKESEKPQPVDRLSVLGAKLGLQVVLPSRKLVPREEGAPSAVSVSPVNSDGGADRSLATPPKARSTPAGSHVAHLGTFASSSQLDSYGGGIVSVGGCGGVGSGPLGGVVATSPAAHHAPTTSESLSGGYLSLMPEVLGMQNQRQHLRQPRQQRVHSSTGLETVGQAGSSVSWARGRHPDSGFRLDSDQGTAAVEATVAAPAGHTLPMPPPLLEREYPATWVADANRGEAPGCVGGINGQRMLPSITFHDMQARGHGQPKLQHQTEAAHWQASMESSGGVYGAGVGTAEGTGMGNLLRHPPRRPSFRAGSDFDFVSALGLLLDEDDFHSTPVSSAARGTVAGEPPTYAAYHRGRA